MTKQAKAAPKPRVKVKAIKVVLDRDWTFTKTIRGTVKAKTLEDAEAKLDHGENTETLRRRGVKVTGRKVDVDEGSMLVTYGGGEVGWSL